MEELMATHTVIVVAHRLSTIKNVDRILVFDKGKVVEEGNFNELLEKNGLFRKMYDAAQSE
jgi:ABC-type multidrug transport system fused ATPase/permease subunit